MSYTVRYTDTSKQPIIVEDQTVNDTALDVTLFGRIDLEYGEELNEDMLHIMERFACPQNSSSTPTNTYPDYAINGNSLTQPSVGQLWFNSTVKKPFVWNGTKWESIRLQGNIAGNWGQILDGSQIPRPVNPSNGYVYQYSECIWSVAPASIPTAFTYMACTTDTNGFVTMKYRAYGDTTLTSTIANYLIIAIAGNTNYGQMNVTPATPFVSGTPTPTPTISVTPSISVTPTLSLTPTVTKTITPTPAVSNTAAPTPTTSPSPTVSNTPAASVTPTPSITPTPSPFVDSCTTCTTEGLQCCVAVNSFLPDGMIAGDISVGHNMVLADQKTLEPGVGTVTYSEPSLQPAVRVVTKSGISLVCSTTAPLPTPEGLVDAPFVMGKQVATFKNGQAHWEDVVSVTDVGDTWVQHITVGDKCFWAGEQSNGFILHHNIKCCYCDPDTCPGGVWQPPNCCMC